jgi:hypothetical protein
LPRIDECIGEGVIKLVLGGLQLLLSLPHKLSLSRTYADLMGSQFVDQLNGDFLALEYACGILPMLTQHRLVILLLDDGNDLVFVRLDILLNLLKKHNIVS